jgi:predicted N-acyltransferase
VCQPPADAALIDEVAVLRSVEAVDPAEWDAIASDDYVFQRHGYLLALERARVNDGDYRFFTVRDPGGRLVSHACFYSITTPLDVFLPRSRALARLIATVRRVRGSFLTLTSVECGVPTALGPAIAFRSDLSTCERRMVLARLADEMHRFATEIGAATIVVRDFHDGETPETAVLAEKGYRRIPLLETAEIRGGWPTFDDYLAALRHGYRQTIRREIARARRAGLRRQTVIDYAEFAETMAKLWAMTCERSTTYQRERLTPRFFEGMGRLAGASIRCRLYWLGDEVVGFSWCHPGRRRYAATYLGVSYAHNRRAALIFNMYYDCIADGIAAGASTIDLGIGTYDLKARLGAERAPLYAFARHRLRGMTPLLARALGWLTPRHEGATRHVFKHAPSDLGIPRRED